MPSNAIAGPVRGRRSLVAAIFGVAVLAFAAPALGTFSSAPAAPSMSARTALIFPGMRSTTAWNLRDASNGSESNATSPFLVASDSRSTATGVTFASAFSATKYLDFDYPSPLPGGLSTSAATFAMTFTAASGTSCFYFEVRRLSTNGVIGTYGSPAAPVSCGAALVTTSLSTPLAEVSTTTVANDIRIRVYGNNTVVGMTSVDLATLAGSTLYSSFTLAPVSFTDASSGTPATTPWALSRSDSSGYATANNWATSFNSSRYLKLTFPSLVAAGATISSATLNYAYKPDATGVTISVYYEIYNGSILIGSRGSSSSPYSSCSSAVSYCTDTFSMPEVNLEAEADNLVIRVYQKTSVKNHKSLSDLATLDLLYFLA
jgi:hypothetical protein